MKINIHEENNYTLVWSSDVFKEWFLYIPNFPKFCRRD